jgi:hypothetical protein
MIISDEQVQLAIEYLQRQPGPDPGQRLVDPAVGVTPELVARVRDEVSRMPDTRLDRVADGRELVSVGVSPDEVAAKMIGRIISDSIR